MKSLILTALVLTMSLGFVGKVAAKEAKALKAVFVSVADDKKSINVTTGGKKNPMDKAVTIDDKTKITVEGADAKMEDLKPGMKLTITPGEGIAETIAAVAGKKPKA